MQKKRIFASLLLTALVCAPLPAFYGRLDTEAVPPELAAKAVAAKRYVLTTMQYEASELDTVWKLECYDRNDRLLRNATYTAAAGEAYYADCEYDRSGNLIYRLTHLDGWRME